MIKEIELNEILKEGTVEHKLFTAIERPKIEISKAIKKSMETQKLSLRKISNAINEMNFEDYKASYTQIARVTGGDNFHIDTLLKVLDVLNLKIQIVEK